MAVDKDKNKVLDANEVSQVAIASWRNNPNNQDTNLTRLQGYAAEAVKLREEIDKAPVIPASIEGINKPR